MRAAPAVGPLLALSIVLALPASAQLARASVDVGGTGVRFADSVDVTALALSPMARFAWPRAIVAAAGSWSPLGTDGWTTQGVLEATALATSRGALSGELTGSLGGSAHEDGTHTSQLLALARLHADVSRAGAWLGAGGGRTWSGEVWRSLLLGEIGGWMRTLSAWGVTTLSASATPTMVDDSLRYVDLAAEGSWETARLELTASLGARAGAVLPEFGGARRAWGSVQAVRWFSSNAAVVAAVGTYPVDPTQGYPGGQYATLGLRLSTPAFTRAAPSSSPTAAPAESPRRPAAEVTVITATEGQRTVRVWAPSATRVELTGDFTSWSPLGLAAAGGGWWAVTLPIKRGTYQMNIRSDGGPWRAPAGLPTLRDEFGGTVGVLAVP
jgi:hypothetical protein